MNDTQIWVQLEFESIEAKGQSLPDGFQRRFLEAPELEEGPQALNWKEWADEEMKRRGIKRKGPLEKRAEYARAIVRKAWRETSKRFDARVLVEGAWQNIHKRLK